MCVIKTQWGSFVPKFIKPRDFTGDAENSCSAIYDYDYNDDTVGQQGKAAIVNTVINFVS